MIVLGSPFSVDWQNLDAVIAYAKQFGAGHVVIKHPDRSNYNICAAERTDLYQPEWVVYETEDE